MAEALQQHPSTLVGRLPPASASGRHLVRRAKQLSAVHSPRHRHTTDDALTLYLGHQMGQAVA
ncbi:hypothetical protein ASF24_22065 [Methylobacterium sp. Leaf86]|nr:hypothetical protein ASF24_22065 [Methylobacterium sp. Leaf86]